MRKRAMRSRTVQNRPQSTLPAFDIGIGMLVVLALLVIIVLRGNTETGAPSRNKSVLMPGSPEVHTVIDLQNHLLHPRQLAYDAKRDGIWFWTSTQDQNISFDNKVYFYDIKQQRLKSWPIYSEDWSSQLLAGLAVAPDGDIWIGWNHNLVRFQPSDGKYVHYLLPAQPRYPLSADVIGDLPSDLGIADLAISHDGTIWIARYAALSLTTFNPTKQVFQEHPLPSTTGDPARLTISSDDHVFFTTNLSASHPGYGAETIGEYNPQSDATVVYPQNAQALALAPNGDLFSTSSGRGSELAQLRANTRAAAAAQHRVAAFDHAGSSLVIANRSLATDLHGRVWVAIAGQPKIGVLNPDTGQMREFTYSAQTAASFASRPDDPEIPLSPAPGSVWVTPIAAMIADGQGHLWFIRDLNDQIEEVAA